MKLLRNPWDGLFYGTPYFERVISEAKDGPIDRVSDVFRDFVLYYDTKTK